MTKPITTRAEAAEAFYAAVCGREKTRSEIYGDKPDAERRYEFRGYVDGVVGGEWLLLDRQDGQIKRASECDADMRTDNIAGGPFAPKACE
jgi:hypothetical protein